MISGTEDEKGKSGCIPPFFFLTFTQQQAKITYLEASEAEDQKSTFAKGWDTPLAT